MMREVAGKTQRKVLVVEDDHSIALGLRINLEGEGYSVLLADDGERGLELALWGPRGREVGERGEEPDLVILDIMLPKMNGLEVLQAIRREGRTMPIILLSARTAEMDKVTGLELGAEDYVAKPFSLAELLARVRAALRRGAMAPPANLHAFGDVIVDEGARSVRRGGLLVDVTATEFDLLICLLRAKGRVLTREAIFQEVWGPNHHGTPRTIDNFVQQLRAKLEIDPQSPRHFQTVRGVGYRFSPT
ncbi:MAG TPA: response regulator transcription factor [Polyangiaceae bacterium]|nr:response regulator transcription factor [Polyangiaceae bacterium]